MMVRSQYKKYGFQYLSSFCNYRKGLSLFLSLLCLLHIVVTQVICNNINVTVNESVFTAIAANAVTRQLVGIPTFQKEEKKLNFYPKTHLVLEFGKIFVWYSFGMTFSMVQPDIVLVESETICEKCLSDKTKEKKQALVDFLLSEKTTHDLKIKTNTFYWELFQIRPPPYKTQQYKSG